MILCFDFIGGRLGACSALVVSHITNLTGWLGKPFLHPVQSPFGDLAMCECFSEMLHFILEKVRFIANCFCSMGKSINYTVLS